MPVLQYIFCTLILIFAIPAAYASNESQQPITLGSYYIPGLVDSSTEGKFVEILNEIEQRTGITFTLSLKPTKRMQRDFKRGSIIGYFPELYEHLPLPLDQVYVSEPFWTKKIYIFSRDEASHITNIDMLNGKRIALVRGYSYGREIVNNKKITITYVDSDIQSIKLLKLNRVDFVLGDGDSTPAAIQKTQAQKEIFFNLESPIHYLDVFFVFQKNEKGQTIAKKVSKAIKGMKRDGLLPTQP